MRQKQYTAIFGDLIFQTALHVGTGRDHEGTDAPLRRTVSGELILPGTAIAGALRTLATRLAPHLSLPGERRRCLALKHRIDSNETPCGCAVCRLFGDVRPGPGANEKEGGRASRIWVYDAPLSSAAYPFVRDGVGIDRRTGTAARAGRVKYDTEVLPAEAIFTLHLELEDVTEDDERLLAAVLSEWQAGRAWLGGKSSRGLGQAVLQNVRKVYNELSTGDELLAYLRAEDRTETAKVDADWLPQRRREVQKQWREGNHSENAERTPLFPFVQASFRLLIDGPFVINDLTTAAVLGYDHVSAMDGIPYFDVQLRPLLPGSALRGVLRSHAEKIARTLATDAAWPDGDTFLHTCPACNPLESNPDKPLTKCDSLLDLSSEQEAKDRHLCLACRLFGSTRRGSRLRVMDAPLMGTPQWKSVDFLAIDRFTGGALQGAKFDAAVLWRPTFDVTLHLEEPASWELGWLALLLRDLQDRRLTVGFGAAKGFGHAQARDLQVRVGFGDHMSNAATLAQHEIEDVGLYRVAEFTGEDWLAVRDQVTMWVDNFHETLRNVDRGSGDSLPSLQTDSYFNGAINRLYTLEER